MTSATVQAQLQQILALLAAATGATLIGGDAVVGKPYVLSAGTLKDQLTATLTQLNQLVSDLASQAAGLGAAKIGDVDLGGSPYHVGAGNLHDQLTSITNGLNAHTGSGDHDGRYPRLTYSNGQLYNAGQNIAHGDIKAWPRIGNTYYNSDPGRCPGRPLQHVRAAVEPDPRLRHEEQPERRRPWSSFIRNTSAQQLYILVNVYRMGA